MGLNIPKERKAIENQVDDIFDEISERRVCSQCLGRGCNQCINGLVKLLMYCGCGWHNYFGYYECQFCGEDLVI